MPDESGVESKAEGNQQPLRTPGLGTGVPEVLEKAWWRRTGAWGLFLASWEVRRRKNRLTPHLLRVGKGGFKEQRDARPQGTGPAAGMVPWWQVAPSASWPLFCGITSAKESPQEASLDRECTLFPCQQRNCCERIDGKLMLTGVNDGCSPPLCSGYWHGLLSAVWRHLPQPERICMSLARLENVPLEKRFWCHFKCHKYCISSSLRVRAYMCAYSLRGGIPGGSAGKSPPDNAGDALRSPGGGNCNPLQYSCLEIPFLPGNPMDRGAWRTTVHGVTKSWTRLCD